MQIQTAAADYSLKEEIAHSVTHGIGALLSVIGLATLILHASKYGDVWHIVSASIYGSTLIALYTSSTLYHSVTLPDLKRFLRKLDHAAIFLLIAGTDLAPVRARGQYLPFFCRVSLRHSGRSCSIASAQPLTSLEPCQQAGG